MKPINLATIGLITLIICGCEGGHPVPEKAVEAHIQAGGTPDYEQQQDTQFLSA